MEFCFKYSMKLKLFPRIEQSKIMAIHITCDLNFIAFSSFSLFSRYGKIKNPLTTNKDQANFITGLTNQLFHALNQLPKGGSVTCCLDSRSWRKEFYDGYKSTREDKAGNKGIMDKESKEIFYKLMDEFADLLRSIGISVLRTPQAEGDDLLYAISRKAMVVGDSCIIITGDRDLCQAVCGENEPFTLVWTNKSNSNKIFVPSGWKDSWLTTQTGTIFDFTLVDDRDIINKLIRDNKLEVEVIHAPGFILKKILIGDDGDTVPSSWTIKKDDGKSVRLTDKKADKVIELVYDKYNISKEDALKHWKDAEFKDFLAGTILRVMGDVDGTTERQKVVECLDRNARLVWLKDEHLPPVLLDRTTNMVNAAIKIVPNRDKFNRRALLSKTRFENGSSVPRAHDPFALMRTPDDI